MRAQEALVLGTRRLAAAGIEGAATDARRLMAFAMGVVPERLTLVLQDDLGPAQHDAFTAAITAREARQPVAQITGLRRFWGAEFRVTRATLDPRPETERLVELALAQPFARILDLGTGTGCILISLLRDSTATGIGVDLSPEALAVAQDNADRLGVAARAEFLCSDWFAQVPGTFDLIVSNPPYIAGDEMAGLAPDVRDWEPHLALTPGGDGLDAYRVIAAGAREKLAPEGRIFVEIGPTQGPAVAEFFAQAGLGDVQIHADLDHRDRVVSAQNAAIGSNRDA